MTTSQHRSIRSYKSDAIESKVLEELIEIGIRASTSGNLQSWSVIATEDPAQRQKLYEIHREQKMILEAPVVLTFCSDFQRTWTWLKANQAKQSFDDLLGFLKGAFDAVIAAQTIVLAAEERGLGICYMGTTLWGAGAIIDLLNIPEGVFPVTSLVMGWPNENPPLRDRLPLNSVLHREHYKKWDEASVSDLYKSRNEAGWSRVMSSPTLKADAEKNAIQNLAQYYTSDLKYGKKLHRETSQKLVALLKSQLFWNHD